MPEVEARRSPRIDYRAPVELLAPPDEEHGVLAQAIDLGPGGIRVTAPKNVPVGAAVTCRFAIDGRPAAVAGRIAWSRVQDADRETHRLGICFDPVSSYTESLLEHVVARGNAGYRAVELQFAGLDSPVIARAQARTHGLRLSAALPILRRGSELSFRLDEEGTLFHGRVTDAVLAEEAGGRRLEVDIDVEEHDSVRFRRRARYGYANELDAKRLACPEPPATETARPSSKWKAGLWLLLGVLVGAVLALTFAPVLLLPTLAPPSDAPHVAKPAPLVPPVPAHVAPPEPPQPAATPVLALVPAPTNATQAPAAMRVPQAAIQGLETRVRIPFEGSLEGMLAREWAEPHALAIDLPNGRSRLAGSYPINDGGVSELRLSARGPELLLRLKLTEPIEHYTVSAQGGVLDVLLRRAAVPSSLASSPPGE